MYLNLDQEANYVFTSAVRKAERAGTVLTGEYLLLEILLDGENSCVNMMRDFGADIGEMTDTLKVVTEGVPENLDESIAASLRLYVAADYLSRIQDGPLQMYQLLYIVAALDMGASGRVLRNEGIGPEEVLSVFCGGKDDGIPENELNAIKFGIIRRRDSFLKLNLPDGGGLIPNRFYIPESEEKGCLPLSGNPDNPEAFRIESVAEELVGLAKRGAFSPLVGREAEIDTVIKTLCRKSKRNPVLLGEAGVGKTAIVEELARRISKGAVPDKLKNHMVFSLNHSALFSHTKYRGELETKLFELVKYIKESGRAILYIDEIHMICRSPGDDASLNMANLLKPALARGDFPCIGSTTHSEYKNTIRKDLALDRRFMPIKIGEPDAEMTKGILSRLSPVFSKYHNCTYGENAIPMIVELAERYMPSRRFPDKALDIMDACGASVQFSGANAQVGERTVVEVVSRMTGVPSGMMLDGEVIDSAKVRGALLDAVKGQESAIEYIMSAFARAELFAGRGRPLCSLLFVGLSGTGKSLAAKTIMKTGFPEGDSHLVLDMDEYGEYKSHLRLAGAPPGWSGYNEGGLLSEKLRRSPRCLVFVKNIHLAHASVKKFFMEIMDSGCFEDGDGKMISCESAVFIFTCEPKGSFAGFSGKGAYDAGNLDGFDPEFEAKCDAVVRFKALDKAAVGEIVKSELAAINRGLKRCGKRVSMEEGKMAAIIDEASDRGSAAGLKRKIEDAVSLERPCHAEKVRKGELGK